MFFTSAPREEDSLTHTHLLIYGHTFARAHTNTQPFIHTWHRCVHTRLIIRTLTPRHAVMQTNMQRVTHKFHTSGSTNVCTYTYTHVSIGTLHWPTFISWRLRITTATTCVTQTQHVCFGKLFFVPMIWDLLITWVTQRTQKRGRWHTTCRI